jgi:hypothetical protein
MTKTSAREIATGSGCKTDTGISSETKATFMSIRSRPSQSVSDPCRRFPSLRRKHPRACRNFYRAGWLWLLDCAGLNRV